MYICVYIYVCVCVYVYMYTYIHIYSAFPENWKVSAGHRLCCKMSHFSSQTLYKRYKPHSLHTNALRQNHFA